MAEGLGNLIDKLCIVNLKLWHVQDEVAGAADAGEGLDAETVQKLHILNLQRNQLISEINLRTGDELGQVVKLFVDSGKAKP